MLQIIDFEDGLQEFISSRLDTQYQIQINAWDRAGNFQFDNLKTHLHEKNIVILSKPYDCLERSVLSGKYPQDDFTLLQDWSRRNWRYTNPEIYEEINRFMEVCENKLIIHPEELNKKITAKRIEKYTSGSFNWDITEYEQFARDNINLR